MTVNIPSDGGKHLLLLDFVHEDLGLMFDCLVDIILGRGIGRRRGWVQEFRASGQETLLEFLKKKSEHRNSIFIQREKYSVIRSLVP